MNFLKNVWSFFFPPQPPFVKFINIVHDCGNPNHPAVNKFLEDNKDDTELQRHAAVLLEVFRMRWDYEDQERNS